MPRPAMLMQAIHFYSPNALFKFFDSRFAQKILCKNCHSALYPSMGLEFFNSTDIFHIPTILVFLRAALPKQGI